MAEALSWKLQSSSTQRYVRGLRRVLSGTVLRVACSGSVLAPTGTVWQNFTGLSAPHAGGRFCISPLTDERASAAGLEADATGYFLYERSQSGGANDVSVLAQIHSEEAAFRLSRMLGMD